jgi:hypothetical protein
MELGLRAEVSIFDVSSAICKLGPNSGSYQKKSEGKAMSSMSAMHMFRETVNGIHLSAS